MTKRSFGFFAAIVAATVGLPVEAHADPPDAGSAAGSRDAAVADASQTAAQCADLVAQAATAQAAERTALLARLTACESRLATAQQQLESCVASRDTAIAVIARRCVPTAEQVRDLCPDLCVRGGGGRMVSGACECIEGYRHPAARRGRTAAVAACMCVNAAPPPERDRTPEQRREPPRESAACPPGATDAQGRSIAGQPAPEGDRDCDGYLDDTDNCPYVPIRDQIDTDLDGLGDACDIDDHSDRVYLDWIEAALRQLCTEGHTDYPVCIELQRLREQEVSFQVTAEAVRVAMRDICRDPSTDDEIFICSELRRLGGVAEDHEQRLTLLERFVGPGRVTLGVGTYSLSPSFEAELQMGFRFHPRVSIRGHASVGLDLISDAADRSYTAGGGGSFEFTLLENDDVSVFMAGGIFGLRGSSLTDGDAGVLTYFGGFGEVSLTVGRRRGFHVGARVLLGRHETDTTQPHFAPGFQFQLGWQFL